MLNPMTLQEFYDELNSHDWYYMYSDDHRVWSAGERDRKRLQELSKQIEGGQKLYEEFFEHHFSGEIFGTTEAPKPERPSSDKV